MKTLFSRYKSPLLMFILTFSLLGMRPHATTPQTAQPRLQPVITSSNVCTTGCEQRYQGCLAGAGDDPEFLAACAYERDTCLNHCPPGEPVYVLIYNDQPDPSLPGKKVNVHVKVSGDGPTPTGTVTISGASTTCSFTLNPAGIGQCAVEFYGSGNYVLTATYNGDSTYSGGTDTEDHTVK